MKGHPIDKDFNTKPYQAFRRTSRIVHLHGPKPNHYLDWLLTGKCEFGNMCEQGFAYALCDYAMEYDQVGTVNRVSPNPYSSALLPAIWALQVVHVLQICP